MKRSSMLALVAALLTAFLPLGSGRADDAKKGWLPAADDFTKAVLEIARSYATDGTHRYFWPRKGTWPGTTMDLVYDGEKICERDPDKRCFCCGLTFEVFARAYEKLCKDAKKPFKILDLDAKGALDLRKEWFGPTEKDRTTLQKAITKFGLGKKVALADARPGDFCQFWRRSGNGHSVIFLGVEKDSSGRLRALKYWSTQSSTNGIHENTETFSHEANDKKGVIPEETYIARVGS